MSYFKPVSISLSPNVESDDLKLALNLLIRPWMWKKGKGIDELENSFKNYLNVKHAISFNSGRSCLYAILKTIIESEKLDPGGKVFQQAFTCNASINPVLWNNFSPVYVDCDENNFNIDIKDLIIKIKENPDAKILIVQHTFGLPVNMDEIISIVNEKGLILIEDCAHSLGSEFKNKKTGTFGKAGFFSFSRDKVISSVYGGIAVTNNDQIANRLRELQKEFGQPSNFWILQQIWHPLLLHFIILPIYNFIDLGKILLVLAQWLHILSKAVNWKEKRGQKPDYFPKALPNALSIMAYNQFGKLERFETARQNLFNYYNENLKNTLFDLPETPQEVKQSYLRYTVKNTKAHDIIYEAWHNQNILLGDWYTTPIAPFDTIMKDVKYKKGSCPKAEKLSKITLNLPTHINISKQDADRIVNFLKKFKSEKYRK